MARLLGLLLALGAKRGQSRTWMRLTFRFLQTFEWMSVALGFTLLMAMLTGIILGMAPAIQVSAIPH